MLVRPSWSVGVSSELGSLGGDVEALIPTPRGDDSFQSGGVHWRFVTLL